MKNFTRRDILAAGLCTATTGLAGCTTGILTQRTKWKYTTKGYPFVTPTVDGDYVYGACNDGAVYAFSRDDGSVKWRYPFYDTALSSTVPVADEVVYYAGTLYDSVPNGTVHAIDTVTGEPQWQTSFDHSLYSATIIIDDVLYVNGDDNTALHALDATTGNILDIFDPLAEDVMSLEIADERAFVTMHRRDSDGPGHGYVAAFDRHTGEMTWTQRTSHPIESSGPAISDGRVIVESAGTVSAFNTETGDLHWQVEPADGNGFRSWAAFGDSVYLGSGNYLYAIDATDGSHKWRAPTERIVDVNVVVDDGTVYAVDNYKYLYAFDAESGEEQWRYELETRARSAPTLGPETVYVGTHWSIEAIRR